MIPQYKSTHMKLANFVDPTRCWQLTSGVLGIYLTYLMTGIIHESMLKEKYVNWETKQEEAFTWPSGFLIFPCGITWIIGAIVNRFQIQSQNRVEIPAKNAFFCGITVAISTLTYTYAIYLTNFPVVMMFKSCNILSVILVGVLCSRVKDKKLKLGIKKIIVGVIVTAGIIMFKVYDPESGHKDEKKTEIMGIVLLLASLLADGFLPDFQAQIKSVYKPQPMEMMTAINKWVAIVALLYSCALQQTWLIIKFMMEHRLFVVHMLAMGVLSTFGQMFVYRMIKQFKQHFAPFVITTRKIFTVGLSIIYYKHDTNLFQLMGLVMVFAIVTYEFVAELIEEKERERLDQEELIKNSINNSLAANSEDSPLNSTQTTENLSEEEIKAKEQEIYESRLQPNNENITGEAE